MSAMDRVFSDFDNADPTAGGGGGLYINTHGVHTVEIGEIKFRESERSSDIFYIVEFVVKETNTPDMVRVENVTYTWTHKLTQQFFGAANAKQFLAAALGIDPASPEAQALNSEQIKETFGEEQPLKGTTVRLTTKPKKTQNGSDFTVHEWSPAA
jgi:hypothetical protein